MSTYGTIYLATNTVTGKVYVGQTKQPISKRWYQHCKDAGRRSYPLHLAIRKHGAEAFSVTEIGRAESQVQLNEMELQLVREHRADQRGHGYNVRAGGDCGGEFSLETRKKISEAGKGRTPPNKGKRMPPHQLEQMKARFKLRHPCTGKTWSAETRRKISEAAKGNRRWLGKKHSAETRAKISASERGKLVPADVCAKMSASSKNRFADPEQRRIQSERHKGKPWSDARRAAQIARSRRAA